MNIYSIEEKKAFKECSLLRFETPDEKWLDFVSANRQGNYQGKHYDLIYGAVANDDVYRTDYPIYDRNPIKRAGANCFEDPQTV